MRWLGLADPRDLHEPGDGQTYRYRPVDDHLDAGVVVGVGVVAVAEHLYMALPGGELKRERLVAFIGPSRGVRDPVDGELADHVVSRRVEAAAGFWAELEGRLQPVETRLGELVAEHELFRSL